MRMIEVALAEYKNEPVTMKLAGESFECLPYVPAGVHADLADYDYSLPKTLAFLEGIVKDEAERKRFQKFIHGETQIHHQMLVDTLEAAIGVYAGRPLAKPEPSAVGPKTTSPTSKARSKAKAKKPST